MVIRPDGNVGVGTTTPEALLDVNGNLKVSGHIACDGAVIADGLVVTKPDNISWPEKTGYLSVPAAAFTREIDNTGNTSETTAIRNWGASLEYFDQSNDGDLYRGECAVAPIYLPNSAIITRIVAYFHDRNSERNVTLSLYRDKFFDGSSSCMTSLETIDMYDRQFQENSVIDYPEVDNFLYNYYLKVNLPIFTVLYGARIEYKYTSPKQ